MATEVIHKRDARPGDVYIGRPSKWGNPFVIGRDGDRDEVIRKYEAWLACRPDLLAALAELRGNRLVCWCAPQRCHGDVLARLAEAQVVAVQCIEMGAEHPSARRGEPAPEL